MKKRFLKPFAMITLVSLVNQIAFPLTAKALTTGPSQPEVQSFEPVTTTDMVDLFTGDFSYNIPLMEVPGPNGGYPLNLFYHSGIGMDQEASWIGLGWNLNVGAITRDMRGLPDDFKGDEVVQTTDMKNNVTFGARLTPDIELFGANSPLQFGVGFSLYYNNYRGVGVSLEPNLGLKFGMTDHLSANLGFGLSLDSQEGLSANLAAGVGASWHRNLNEVGFKIGVGYSSSRGLSDFSLSGSITKRKAVMHTRQTKDHAGVKVLNYGVGGGSSYSFATTAHTPFISQEMAGINASIGFKSGPGFAGLFPNATLSGFFSSNWVKNRNEPESIAAYGYNYLESAPADALTDMNREKDGMVRKHSPNLAMPQLTTDAYNIAGQGTGGMFRAYRNDVGIIHDREMKSTYGAANLGFDFGGGHNGFSASGNVTTTRSGKWQDDNQIVSGALLGFHGAAGYAPEYETYFFKTYGEPTTDPLNDLGWAGGNGPVRVEILPGVDPEDPLIAQYIADDRLVTNSGQQITPAQPTSTDASREPRNILPIPVTNHQLGVGSNANPLPEFVIRYYPSFANVGGDGQWKTNDDVPYLSNAATTPVTLNRQGPAHQLGGFIVQQADGSRYIYALPAKNKKQVEMQFSVNGTTNYNYFGPKVNIPVTGPNQVNYQQLDTDQYLSRTEIPEFSHSWMLTSVLGADYVDADGIAGPSQGDFGYWVKFTYVKGPDQQWRAPYTGANYAKGSRIRTGDDKGTFLYGEKEQWYLGTIETKTHIAEFYLAPRNDARGATQEVISSPNPAAGSVAYKLTNIALYAKSERYLPNGSVNPAATPLQVVHLEQDYSLCKNAENNIHYSANYAFNPADVSSGKLTLKKLWFTYENSNRGALSPYVFDYHETNGLENPMYNAFEVDRWGNYRACNGICDEELENPWVNQSEDPQEITRRNREAAVWNLKEVNLPSGGQFLIDYESDDYAYVQNKTAMQMMKLTRFTAPTTGLQGMELYPAIVPNAFFNNPDARKVYFELETPISASLPQAEKDEIIRRYFDKTDQVYIKSLMTVFDQPGGLQEWVAGYFDIDKSDPDWCGLDVANGGFHSEGWVTLARADKGPGLNHPVSLAAWRFVRTNLSDLMVVPALPAGAYNPATANDVVAGMQVLVGLVQPLMQTLGGYYNYARSSTWGRVADMDRSFIRLNTPDKVKYGGGCRVKRLVMRDNWAAATNGSEASNEYGSVYHYKMKEGGLSISSGVAQYEPMTGGEEIALRSGRNYPDKMKLQSANNLFFEYPANESLYPGAVVGYRQVTVRSLNTEGILATASPQNPSPVSSTGQQIHYFWTAKDYPVLNEQTSIEKRFQNQFIPLFLFGAVTTNRLTAAQGYSIQLNDMHGKPRRVENYGQDANGQLITQPLSWAEYHYQDQVVNANTEEEYRVLNNEVDVLRFDVDPADRSHSLFDRRLMGQDYDFVVDMRETKTSGWGGGIDFNTELFPPPLPPIPMIWPTLSRSRTEVRLAVTNKIIHRSGIMKGMTAYNEGSIVKTEYKCFDALSGRPLLSTVSNDYEDPVYKYEYPAHWAYANMGAASKNAGLQFTASLTQGSGDFYYAPLTILSSQGDGQLIPGDEFIVERSTAPVRVKAIYTGKKANGYEFWCQTSLAQNNLVFHLVRSGRRNQIVQNVQEISALKDPTRNREMGFCDRSIDNFNLATSDSTVIVQQPIVIGDTCNKAVTTAAAAGLAAGPGLHELSSLNVPNVFGCISCTHLSVGGSPQFQFMNITQPQVTCCAFDLYNPFGLLVDLSTVTHFAETGIIIPNLPFAAVPGRVYEGVNVQIVYNNGATGTGYVLRDVNTTACSMGTTVTYVDVPLNWSTVSHSNSPWLLTDAIFSIDSVLAATATTFSDGWLQDFSDALTGVSAAAQLAALQAAHPFATGEKGIFRPRQSYVYVENRDQSPGINTGEDGTWNDMPIFNFQGLIFTECGKKWRLVNEVTRYSPYSYETENRDVLGVYSSALYAYGGKVPVAVSGNADVHEIGFEGFEEYAAGQPLEKYQVGRGNLDFYTVNSAAGDAYPIHSFLGVLYANGTGLNTATPQYPVAQTPLAKLFGRSDGTVFDPSAEDALRSTSVNANAYSPVTLAPYFHLKPGNSLWAGAAALRIPNFPVAGNLNLPVAISADRAHTGVRSLWVNSEAAFDQNHLLLGRHDAYTLSAWISRSGNQVPTYKTEQPPNLNPGVLTGIRVEFYNANYGLISSTVVQPVGHIIEGWQKIEGDVNLPAGTVRIKLVLQPGWQNGSFLPAFFDDIRIQPLKSKMNCYVYDPSDFRVRAVLDDNNFATLYEYDEQGNLFLVRKETERGIMTIQESRSFMPEN